jgi:hypothetical protein
MSRASGINPLNKPGPIRIGKTDSAKRFPGYEMPENPPSFLRTPALVLALALGFAAGAHALDFGGANDITAVSGRTSKDYVRTKLANGSFAPESFAFGKGGNWSGEKVDGSIDNMSFLDVAHTIAAPLASQNYLPAKEPSTAKLLIMVYWGTTHAPEHASESGAYGNLQAAEQAWGQARMIYTNQAAGMAIKRSGGSIMNTPDSNPQMASLDEARTTAMAAVAAENRMRERDDILNVKMLGYDSWWVSTSGDRRGTAVGTQRDDLITEIEEDRYFVVLMAYDFQLVWKQKKHKLLWETRFSIRQRHHDFDKDLPAMAQYASQYFGQDSGGLVHREIPLGHVDIGAMKSLGSLPEK